MPDEISQILTWIESQRSRMVELVTDWSNINSHARNLTGLRRQREAIQSAFVPLGGKMMTVALPDQEIIGEDGEIYTRPLGKALSISIRPEVERRVFLGIHMDTVFGKDHLFQKAQIVDDNRIVGPGVADAKGGIVVMLIALAALEKSRTAANLGWDVFLNPDEEIGSPGSTELFRDYANRASIGLVYEPALPDGGLIGARKGSGNFDLVIRGRSAHAGRCIEEGRNAIRAAAECAMRLQEMHGQREGLTINLGKIDGGGPVNVVPDLAVLRFNVRVVDHADQSFIQEMLEQIVFELNQKDGFEATLHGGFGAPPKEMTESLETLLNYVAEAGRSIDLDLEWTSSGGVCDGNRLVNFGLPTVDTLGPVGGNIHSDEEYLVIESLVERAKLSAAILLNLASDETEWPITG